MYAVHKGIYQKSRDGWIYTDIKYCTKSTTKYIGEVIFVNDDYLITENGHNLFVFGKNELIVNIMRKVKVWIIGDKLIINFYKNYKKDHELKKFREYHNSDVYDLVMGNKLGSYVFNTHAYYGIYLLPNGSVLARVSLTNEMINSGFNVLIRLNQLNTIESMIFNSYNDFLDFALGKMTGKKISTLGEFICIGERKILDIFNIGPYETYFETYDFILEQYEHFKMDYVSKSAIKNAILVRDIMYMWDDFVIIIIINGILITIKNCYKVKFYSRFYDMFIDNKFGTYRIYDNKLKHFRFNYDYWNDIDKPQIIQFVMDLLMELDLFLLEICNMIYHEIMMYNWA